MACQCRSQTDSRHCQGTPAVSLGNWSGRNSMFTTLLAYSDLGTEVSEPLWDYKDPVNFSAWYC